MEFLTTDVLTLVENRYRVDQQERTLAGHSLGGLFPLYAMFQNPAKFKTHVACSPSIYWNGQIMLEIEKAYADAHDSLPARLFLSMGELEMEGGISYDGMLRLFDQLQRRDYKDIEIEMKLFPDDDHCTVLAPSLAAGLKFALRSEQPT